MSGVVSYRVAFTSHGENLIGEIYAPEGAKSSLPALVVTGAWRTIKEQMPTIYARSLAERGFRALAFDFRGWGESEGRPRLMEDPFMKAEDITSAASYLAGRDDVSSVGGLAVCASSGYMAAAAVTSDALMSLAFVAPALPSRETVRQTLGGEAGVAAVLDMAKKAREVYAATGQEQTAIAVSKTEATTRPGADYYTNPARGATPAWENAYNPASWEQWIEFDAQAAAPQIRQPLLIVHSDTAASPASVREFAAKMTPAPKELWLDNVTQFDFYDQPGPVKAAADAAADHFAKTLKA